MKRYIDLLAETRAADREEATRAEELNQAAEVAHERASVALGALDAFNEKMPSGGGTCGHCAAASGALVALEYREREQSRAAEGNLRAHFREIRHDREKRHEDLALAHELDAAD